GYRPALTYHHPRPSDKSGKPHNPDLGEAVRLRPDRLRIVPLQRALPIRSAGPKDLSSGSPDLTQTPCSRTPFSDPARRAAISNLTPPNHLPVGRRSLSSGNSLPMPTTTRHFLE